DVLLVFADFSVILLVFAGGLEGGVSSLRQAGWHAIAAAVAGNLVPFVLVTGVFATVAPLPVALLLGTAAGATSTAVVVALLREEHLAGSAGGRFLLGTCAFDDVVGFIILSAILSVVGGQLTVLVVAVRISIAVLVWIAILLGSILVVPRIFRLLGPTETTTLPLLVLFILAAVVAAVGFSVIVGAFIAGLAIAESSASAGVRRTAEVLIAVFGSLFFVVVGFQFDVGLFLNRNVVVGGLLLAAIAIAGKIVAVYPFVHRKFGRRLEAFMVSAGMVPRGEIGLLVGSLGLALGILDQAELGMILILCLVTTVVGGLLFRWATAVARDEYEGRHIAQYPDPA
ncbi:MAG TPA: cation:proton antiporter, partial [Thermoplasmata archaeon]|nr:cation:proton antiporter [Thermoplasmata archaeon]